MHSGQKNGVGLDMVEYNRLKALEDKRRSDIMYDDVHYYKM